MRKHPDECNGQHTPIRKVYTDSASPGPQDECSECGTKEREAWAMGERMARHMHAYAPDDHSIMRCDCGAWLPKAWHNDNLEEGRQIRARRLERLEGALT